MAAALVLALAALLAPRVAAQDGADPYKVMAAFLLNFTRYVTWPAAAFPDGEAPIVIGVLDPDPFGDVLDRTVAGRKSHDRRIEVRRLKSLKEAAGCHVLFVGKAAPAELTELRGRPVLIVGESEDFARTSVGAVALFVAEGRVAFEVNLAAARKSGLDVSSRMLAVARAVYTGGGQ